MFIRRLITELGRFESLAQNLYKFYWHEIQREGSSAPQ